MYSRAEQQHAFESMHQISHLTCWIKSPDEQPPEEPKSPPDDNGDGDEDDDENEDDPPSILLFPIPVPAPVPALAPAPSPKPSKPEQPEPEKPEPEEPKPEEPEPEQSEPEELEPRKQACPGGGAKLIRTILPARISNKRLSKRAEESILSINPLTEAFSQLGNPGLAAQAFEDANSLLINTLPETSKNAYISGLSGKFKVPMSKGKLKGKGMRIGTRDNAQTFSDDADAFWRVRWGYDRAKGT
ncbi:MAG: hypothetical protein Q9164_004741 [Protoblastenia rupestris]